MIKVTPKTVNWTRWFGTFFGSLITYKKSNKLYLILVINIIMKVLKLKKILTYNNNNTIFQMQYVNML